MKNSWLIAIIVCLALLAGVFQPANADGIIIPTPHPCSGSGCLPPEPPQCKLWPCPPINPISQLQIKYHHVSVTIDNQIAVTHVDQVFYNPNDWTIEGTYLFPLPADATVTNFTMWVDGKPMQGKVLSAEEARRTYESIVNQMRDPALLEYVGRGAIQASIYPIPPQGQRRIELEYTQALTAENGLVHYVYPLNTEKFSIAPLESVSVKVDVHASQSVRAVYSPSHPVSIDRTDANDFMAGYEDSQVTPDRDFELYYSIGEAEAFHLFTYRNPLDSTDPDGFFLLLLAPRPDQTNTPVSKDVILVLDHSGSMEGEKFQQAQKAAKTILQHLNSADQFQLIGFSTSVETYANGMRPASEANQASAWVDRLSAVGSTDINRALLEAVAAADAEKPTYLIFLTDGLPTEGVTDSKQILANFDAAAHSNIRLFAFGVGYDVDTYLLDSLTQAHHGLSTYVKPGDALDETLSSFYNRISSPVLTNLSLDFGGISTNNIFPDPLPDLFAGSQVVVVGRYHEGGTADVTLKGYVNDVEQTFTFPEQKFSNDSSKDGDSLSGLPRIWAARKVGFLLSKIRLSGLDQETIDQIVKLSIRYGIVTPYTSYLVTEPAVLGAGSQQDLAQRTYQNLQAMPTAPASGQTAVEKAAGEGALSQSDQAPATSGQSGQMVRYAGARTFVLNNGVWTDTTFDPQKMTTLKVKFLSPEYFALSSSDPDLAAALALGERVIVVSGVQVYEVVTDGVSSPNLNIQPKTQQTPTVVTYLSTPIPAAKVSGQSEPTAAGNLICGGGLLCSFLGLTLLKMIR